MSLRKTLYPFFESTSLLRNISVEDRELLIEKCELVNVDQGETVIEQGNDYSSLKILFHGELEVISKDPATGHQFVVSTLEPGMQFGEKGFLGNGEATASVRAKSNSSILQLSRDNAHSLGVYQTLIENIAGTQAERLQKSNLKQIEALQKTIDQQKEQNSFGRFYIATIVLFAISSVIPDYADESPYFQLAMRWLFLLLILVPAIYAVKQQTAPLSVFGVTLNGWRIAVKEGLLIAIALLPFIILFKIFSADADEPLFTWSTINNYSQTQLLFYLITYIPHAAIQEFIARGVGQGSLQRFMPESHYMHPILIASALFAILHLHLSIHAALMTLVISILFGYVYYRHRTLIGVITLHVILGISATALGII
ncbi:MAG: cyclic nucleotide-binding domain-containing protein [Acidiferrobacterales bacterium]|nr:cyclic nucleotide-binding domain-containing protein [Acidiferrobacterales bacterium]